MEITLKSYIDKADINKPLLLQELLILYPYIKEGTLRQSLKRLVDDGVLFRATRGVYYKPNPSRITLEPILDTDTIIERKYLSKDQTIIGYIGEFELANRLGISTQTPSITTIVTNTVLTKSKIVLIGKRRFKVLKPRVFITNSNYKLLQVLDLMNNLDRFSELSFDKTINVLKDYLGYIKLNRDEINECVSSYPLKTQILFYKERVWDELTPKRDPF
jgi:hypothetical protein